jgi:hypothetical protein
MNSASCGERPWIAHVVTVRSAYIARCLKVDKPSGNDVLFSAFADPDFGRSRGDTPLTRAP